MISEPTMMRSFRKNGSGGGSANNKKYWSFDHGSLGFVIDGFLGVLKLGMTEFVETESSRFVYEFLVHIISASRADELLSEQGCRGVRHQNLLGSSTGRSNWPSEIHGGCLPDVCSGSTR